jgi:hypothetical protein
MLADLLRKNILMNKETVVDCDFKTIDTDSAGIWNLGRHKTPPSLSSRRHERNLSQAPQDAGRVYMSLSAAGNSIAAC